MRTLVERQKFTDNFIIQRFFDTEDEIDDVVVISEHQLYLTLKFLKSEMSGDWPDVLEYLKNRYGK